MNLNVRCEIAVVLDHVNGIAKSLTLRNLLTEKSLKGELMPERTNVFHRKVSGFLLVPVGLILLLLRQAVGQEESFIRAENEKLTSSNYKLTPLGKQIDLPGLRPQVIAISPTQRLLITSGKTSNLIAIDPDSGDLLQRVAFPSSDQLDAVSVVSENILRPDSKALASFTGLLFSRDGKTIYLSNVNGSIKVFRVAESREIQPAYSIPLPPSNAPRRKQEIPSGLALSADERKLYICANLSNQLLEWDFETGQISNRWDVGVAPYDVVVHGTKAYVSNMGGRIPEAEDLTGPAGRGTSVRVDGIRFIANEGSISVVDIKSKVVNHVRVGLSPTDLALSVDERFLVCANTNSDTISIFSIANEQIVDTIQVKRTPSDLYGAAPNALTFSPDGKRLFVANGSQNAIGVIDFDPEDAGDSTIIGLLPTGWYPGAIVYDPGKSGLCVANLKGIPTTPTKREKSAGFNSHQHNGSVGLIPLPTDDLLPPLSERVERNMRYAAMLDAALLPRQNQPARAIPERIGEPSLIEHVVYIIKEYFRTRDYAEPT
jgi:DNA-binding beta-propeller fold protein YncE